jgi:hypothetical protein
MVEYSSVGRSRRAGLRLGGLLVVEVVERPTTRALDLDVAVLASRQQTAATAAANFTHCKPLACRLGRACAQVAGLAGLQLLLHVRGASRCANTGARRPSSFRLPHVCLGSTVALRKVVASALGDHHLLHPGHPEVMS